MNYDNNNFNQDDLMVLFRDIMDFINCIGILYQMQSYLQIITLILILVIYLYIKIN